jgi:hypothetical protein
MTFFPSLVCKKQAVNPGSELALFLIAARRRHLRIRPCSSDAQHLYPTPGRARYVLARTLHGMSIRNGSYSGVRGLQARRPSQCRYLDQGAK